DPKQKAAVRQRLAHWQQDAALASVRGEAIDRLPEDERAAWRRLWDVVESLREEVSGEPATSKPRSGGAASEGSPRNHHRGRFTLAVSEPAWVWFNAGTPQGQTARSAAPSFRKPTTYPATALTCLTGSATRADLLRLPSPAGAFSFQGPAG